MTDEGRPPLTLDGLVERPTGMWWEARVRQEIKDLRDAVKARLAAKRGGAGISLEQYTEVRRDVVAELELLVRRREAHEKPAA